MLRLERVEHGQECELIDSRQLRYGGKGRRVDQVNDMLAVFLRFFCHLMLLEQC